MFGKISVENVVVDVALHLREWFKTYWRSSVCCDLRLGWASGLTLVFSTWALAEGLDKFCFFLFVAILIGSRFPNVSQDQNNLHRALCLPLLTTEIVLIFSTSHRGNRRYDGRPFLKPFIAVPFSAENYALSCKRTVTRTVFRSAFFFEWTDLSIALRVFRVPGSWRHPVCISSFCLNVASTLVRITQRHLRLRTSTSSGPSTKMCKLVWVKHLS